MGKVGSVEFEFEKIGGLVELSYPNGNDSHSAMCNKMNA
jgi:hypothetical protein